jgi:hypothetical protein
MMNENLTTQNKLDYRILCYYLAHHAEIEITHYSGVTERKILTGVIVDYLTDNPTSFKLLLNEVTDQQLLQSFKNNPNAIPTPMFEKLLSEHYDCFGLINKGLAIQKT